ncbi:MAG TPA: hypothetical protein VGW35_14780 [Methylomirabilota bacterium]|jgi:hypothetical protein|nr:hypothetical protein [Methylomirabilota bacterium]
MTAVIFVMLAGMAVGAVAFRGGAGTAIGVVVLGALGAALLDLVGVQWRARRATGGVGESGVPQRVLWLMLRDTFQVSVVVIALVGGLTYMVLVTVALSLQLLPD